MHPTKTTIVLLQRRNSAEARIRTSSLTFLGTAFGLVDQTSRYRICYALDVHNGEGKSSQARRRKLFVVLFFWRGKAGFDGLEMIVHFLGEAFEFVEALGYGLICWRAFGIFAVRIVIAARTRFACRAFL
jgi:hypothetical protein